MSIKNIEIQDSSGNVYYPHTDASVVKYGNSDVGSALSDKVNRTITDTGKTLNRDFTDLGRYRVSAATAGLPTGYTTDNDLILDPIPFINGGTTYRREMLYDIRSTNIYTRQVLDGVYNPWMQLALTESPTFTGIPKVSTAPTGTNTIQIANTAFVANGLVLKPNILQESWNAPTLLNGWVNFGSGFATAGYFKDGFGIIHLKGYLKSGTATVNTIIFQLPVGYKPLEHHGFSVYSNDGGVNGTIQVYSDGNVKIISGGNNSLSLSGITFKAEQ